MKKIAEYAAAIFAAVFGVCAFATALTLCLIMWGAL